MLFTAAGVLLVKLAIVSASYALAIGALLFLVAWLLKRRRLGMWAEAPLIFDDELPEQPLQLGL